MKTLLGCLLSTAAVTVVAMPACAQTAGVAPNDIAASPAVQPTGEPSAATAAASAAPGGGLQDIVVTARRTSESLQRVPVAVTGLNAEALTNLQIQNFGDVAKTIPNLDSQRQFGSANAPQFYLRGVSTGSLRFEQDAGIGLYIDGVYLGRPAGTAFNLADIERVEVLRGPQATLFGRNSTGGAINFITSAPTGEFGVTAEGTVGNYDRYKGRVSLNLPALGPLSARITYLHDENRGYVRNSSPRRTFNLGAPFGTLRSADTFGFENTDAVAATVRLDLSPFTVDYKFDYTDKVSSQLGQQLLAAPAGYPGFPTAPGSTTIAPTTIRQSRLPLDFTSASRLKVQGHSLTASYDINEAISIKSITAYRKFSENVGLNDIDGGAYLAAPGVAFTPLSAVQYRRQHQWSQEGQILGNTENLDFVLGGFYFVEKGRDNNPVFLFAGLPFDTPIRPGVGTPARPALSAFGGLSDYFLGFDGSVRNQSYAGYAHATYRFGDKVELAGGVRYTKDNRRETVFAVASLAPPTRTFNYSDDHWDFDATATYIFSERFRAYGRFATGYVSGGVFSGLEFQQETIKSYEAGLKGDFLDNTFRVNAAIFQSDRKNVQVLSFNPTVGTFLVPLPKERDRGYEVELTAVPTEGLTFNASLGYIDAKLSEALGPRQTLAPKYTFSTSGQYDLPAFDDGSFVSLRYDLIYKDKRFSDPVPSTAAGEIAALPSRLDVNARISLNALPLFGTTARISVWGQNLTNNEELEFARDLGGPVIGVFQVPRTYGVDVGFKF